MRRNRGFVLISVAIALVLLAGLAWYAYEQRAMKQELLLRQAAQAFLDEHKDGQFPSPPTIAEVWAEQERRASGKDGLSPAGTAQERRPAASPLPQPAAPNARSGAFSSSSIPLLSSALLITLLTALGLAGNTYRMARQEGRIRIERDRLAQELDSARAAEIPSHGRAAPWREAALMMVRGSTVPALAYDLDARVIEVSAAFSRLTGYTRVDIPDVKSWLTKVLRTPEAELEAALESFRTKVQGGEIEARTVWTSTGEARTWLCQPLEVCPLEGDSLLLVARATDVTAEAEATRAARAEAESLRVALRQADHAPAIPTGASPASGGEAELEARLAERAQQCEQLDAQLRMSNERLAAQQAELAALRAQEADAANRAKALAGEQRQAAAVLEAAYRAAGAGLCLLDGSLEVLRSNERWREMVRDAGGVQTAVAAIAPLARETLRIRAGTSGSNVRVRGDGGTERTWRVDCQPIVGDAGALNALAVTADDITEQTNREARLQADAERFQIFAEHFEDGFWIADPRAPRLLHATSRAARLRGRPLSRMLEDFSEWTAAVHEEDRERVRQAFSAATVEGSYDVEYRVVNEDASIAWLHDRGVAVHDVHDRLRYVAGTTADITVRRNAAEVTRGTLAILQTLVEQAPARISLKDARGRNVYVNREYTKATGFSAEQLHGKTDAQVFPRAVASRMHETDARALAGDAQQFEETLQLDDGLHHYIVLKFPPQTPDSGPGTLCAIAIDITERRRGEDALRAAESRYRTIAESLPEALLIVRGNRVIHANAAAAELLGTADGNPLVGATLQQLASGTEPGIAEAAKALAAEETGRHRFGARLKGRDGRELEVEVSAAAYETATERAVQFVVHDVAERNARARALQESEAFFRNLCDFAPAALRLLDTAGRCTFASRRWEALVGARARDDWFAQVHPENLDGVRSSYAAPSRPDEPAAIEYRLLDGSGRDRWVLDILLARYDHGQWKGYLSSVIDISERKRTEIALRADHDDLATLLERCPAPVWVTDVAGIGYANQVCRALFRDTSDASRDLDLADRVHPEDLAVWTHARSHEMKAEARFECELRLRRFDGAYRHVRINAVPVAATGEGGTRFVCFLDDITAVRETAQALSIAEQRHAQIVAVLGSPHTDGLGQIRHTAQLVRVMFPDEPELQRVSDKVLSEAQRLEGLMEEMLVPLRSGSRPGA